MKKLIPSILILALSLSFCGQSPANAVPKNRYNWSEYQSKGEQAYLEENFAVAYKYFQKALEELEVRGQENAEIALTLNDLAVLYTNAGNLDKAEKTFLQALDIQQRYLPPNSRTLATTLANLSVLMSMEGKSDESDSYGKQSQAILQKLSDPNEVNVSLTNPQQSPATVAPLNLEYGIPLQNLNNFTLFGDSLDPLNEKNYLRLNRQGLVAFSQGKFTKAESLFLRALRQDQNIYGPYHPQIARILNNLAVASQKQGNYTQSESYFKQALAIQSKAFNPTNPDVTKTLSNFRVLYLMQGKFEEADQLMRQFYPSQTSEAVPSKPAPKPPAKAPAKAPSGKKSAKSSAKKHK